MHNNMLYANVLLCPIKTERKTCLKYQVSCDKYGYALLQDTKGTDVANCKRPSASW